jgi:hypothetical protein
LEVSVAELGRDCLDLPSRKLQHFLACEGSKRRNAAKLNNDYNVAVSSKSFDQRRT